ncbi:1853_t:CDS:2 [Scutellospora calospora]|uniref:1853_t:CDS:1 n=1 Tax=Scutellospora calospora TaxID=85575 RepID=A0ACA9L055_9GLOM|nr:1853_t:CDS:2 [Scutellospora calospora]
MQRFLNTPKYDKKYIFKNPSNLYKNLCNAYKTVKSLDKGIIEYKIDGYLKALLQPIQYVSFLSILSLTNQSIIADKASSLSVLMIELEEMPPNTTAQRCSLKKQNIAKDQLDELNLLLNIIHNPKRRSDFLVQITETKREIEAEKKEKQRLQKHVAIQAKSQEKNEVFGRKRRKQSAYNLVEHSMSTLSEKLADIVLPIDHFGSHLNSSSNVIDSELANQNFCYAGERLYNIWQQDYIHRKERAEEVHALLDENNRFLPLATKGRDSHFLNPIHILQYIEQTKLLGYQYYPSIFSELYSQLVCSIYN